MANERFSHSTQLATLALALIMVGGSASAMTINFTETAAFTTDFGANAANALAAAQAAAAIYTNAFADPISINIALNAVTGTGTLGESSTPIQSISWSNLESAVVGDAKSAADFTAIGIGGSITATDPSGGAGTWWVTHAQAKALGIIGNTTTAGDDGTITIGTGFNYTYNDSGGVAAGTYDLTDIYAHEISEIMGRIGISGGAVGNSSPSYTLLDAFSYQGAAARGLGNGAGTFSPSTTAPTY